MATLVISMSYAKIIYKRPYLEINRKSYQTSASGNILIVLTFTAVQWLSDKGDDDDYDDDDNDDNDDSDDNGS